MSAEFCDTNVLVYAFDRMAGRKRERARELLERLWRTNNGVLSVQVLQELFVTLTRKVARPLSAHQARAMVADLATWRQGPSVAADQRNPAAWGELVIARAKTGEVLTMDPERFWDGIYRWFRSQGVDPHPWRR